MKKLDSLPFSTVMELYLLKKHTESNRDLIKFAILEQRWPGVFSDEIHDLFAKLQLIAHQLDAKHLTQFAQQFDLIIIH